MNGFESSIWMMLVLIVAFFQLNFFLSSSLNDEGIALLKFRESVVNDPFGALSSWNDHDRENKPCSWFGIECVDGHVVSLDLRNSCLEGTLAPELGHLLHITSIILRNNSFSGVIPEEFKYLKELKLLDLGHNNFARPLRPQFGHDITILHSGHEKDAVPQRMLAEQPASATSQTLNAFSSTVGSDRSINLHEQPLSPSQSGPSPQTPASELELTFDSAFKSLLPPPPLAPQVPWPTSDALSHPSPSVKNKPLAAAFGAGGGLIVLALVIAVIYLWKSKMITKIKGISGQLPRTFMKGKGRSGHGAKTSSIEGILNLKRSELEAACEGFSNVIGSSSIGTIYKGTLSNGLEVAVASLPVTSAKEWSYQPEMQFRKKIETLSKVTHKNFVKLMGYCEEENPFTRMMVFEYAPNGTLFEHLHVQEAEHLDWGMRLRVTMGIAYCLEHMHQLVPPITHPNLNTSAVNLAEDYAAKVSDFSLQNQAAAAQVEPTITSTLSPSSATLASNVYSFGLVLMETMTGRAPLSSENNGPLEDWVSDYLRGDRSLQVCIDPMLRFFNPEQLEKMGEVIRKCLEIDPQQRPTMRDVAAKLREITGIDQVKAGPRSSPVWWEEVEVLSVA